MITEADVVVIGGGVVGLTVALELQRQGMQTMRDLVVLDAESGPGGTWRRAWDRLPMRLAAPELGEPRGLDDFGLAFADADPDAPARLVVPRTYAYFEDASNLYVFRPARVVRVTAPRRSPLLRVEYVGPGGRTGELACRLLIDASGHWSTPFVPWVPGMRDFGGRHVTAARLERLGELDGARVLVVGGGRTAVTLVQLLEGRAGSIAWSTRRAPEFRAVPRDARPAAEVGAGSDARVESRPAAWSHPRLAGLGEPPEPAWIPRTPDVEAAIERGLLRSVGPVRRFDLRGAELASGERVDADVVVWATGSHSPLRLRDPRWVTRVRAGWSRSDRRVAIVGDGTSATSVGALAHAVEIARDTADALDRISLNDLVEQWA